MTDCNKLLKEWAIVCQALGDGRQIFIARKGGIAEEEGEFVVENPEFFLFPTYLHQNREELDPRVHLELEMCGEPRDGKIHLRHFARVSDQLKIAHPDGVGPSGASPHGAGPHGAGPRLFDRLRGEHIWSERLLRNRFDWGTGPGLTLLLLRVFELPETIRIPMRQSYGGCRSWITIESPLTLPQGLRPVLNDQEFFLKRDSILQKTDSY